MTVEALREFAPSDLFHVLFPLSIQEQGRGSPVAYGAVALNALNPPCSIGLVEAIELMLPNWDISIEEVVFYLVQQFGTPNVSSTALELQSKYSTGTEHTRLGVIDYWARIYGSK